MSADHQRITIPNRRGWLDQSARALHTLEADRLGVDVMRSAGYAPSDAVSVWRRLTADSTSRAQPLAWLSTHPINDERLRVLEQLAVKYAILMPPAIRRMLGCFAFAPAMPEDDEDRLRDRAAQVEAWEREALRIDVEVENPRLAAALARLGRAMNACESA